MQCVCDPSPILSHANFMYINIYLDISEWSHNNGTRCVFAGAVKPCELSLAATRQAPAASRGRESQSDLFPSSLRGYFYQCGWARQVLDREGLPYSTGLKTDCVCTTDASAFYLSVAVCVSMPGSRQLGEQWIAGLTAVVLPIKSQNSNL